MNDNVTVLIKKIIQSIESYKAISKTDKSIPYDYINLQDFESIHNKHDLYRYINAKYAQKSKDMLIKSYNELKIEDPMSIISKINFSSENRTTFVDKFIKGKKYKSIDISIASENFNIQQGMYNTIDSNLNACSVIKATVNESSRYKNKWVVKDKVFSYSLRNETENNFHTRNYRYKENALLYTSFIIGNPVDVHVFVRYNKGEEYTYYGPFLMFELSIDGKEVNLICKEDISETEVMTYIKSTDKESENFVTFNAEGEIYKESLTRVRLKQGIFRENLLNKHGEKCMICDIHGKDFLVASHIKPYRISNVEQAVSSENGLVLCPNHDKLFDRGYITFDEDGKILISSMLPKKLIKIININIEVKLPKEYRNNKYLKYHRFNIFME